MRTRPPPCSPGRTVGFPSTRVSGSRSIDRDVPSYFQSLEHLLRYCARPPFALERLSVIRDADSRIARIRYVMPRHKAANWVGPGRSRKSTQPGASGVIELTPFEFLAPACGSDPAAAEAPAQVSRSLRAEPPAAAGRHRSGGKGMAASGEMPRQAGTRTADMPRKAAATLMKSPARTTRHGLRGPS